jgi:hypothetical protein
VGSRALQDAVVNCGQSNKSIESPKLIYPTAKLLFSWRYLPMSVEDLAWIAKDFAATVISKE